MKNTHTILDKILMNKVLEIQKKKQKVSLVKLKTLSRKTEIRNFRQAISKQGRLSVIAEIKKASPSKGILRKNFNHMQIAREYEISGLVNAISVLTDEKYFKGKLSFIEDIKEITSMPILRKDFIVDMYQIYESYIAGADAILLIVGIVGPKKLKVLINVTHSLGMACLVEVRSKKEIITALEAGANMIGINARDLKTFKLDKTLFGKLAKLVPQAIITVAESGVENTEDFQNLAHLKPNAVLIGTSLMTVDNIIRKLKQLTKGGEVYANPI